MGLVQTPPTLRQSSRSAGYAPAWQAGYGVPVASKERRRILIVEEVPSASNILQVLLNVLNYDSELALGCEQALAMIGREEFDAVLLDLRNSDSPSRRLISQIQKIRPSLADRVVIITGEVEDSTTSGEDSTTSGYAGRRYLPCAADILLMENVHRRLLALWDSSRKS